MNWQYNAWTLLLFTGAAIALVLAALGWRRRAAPGARPFSLFMLLAAWHALAYALEIGGLNLEFIIFWGKVEYVAICFEPVVWLAFALEYSGLQKWLTRRNLLFLSMAPALVLIASWTNELHGWVKRDFALDRSAGFSNATFTPGPVYWVNVFNVYGVFGLTLLLLLRAFMRAPRPYRAQAGAVLIGNFVPLFGGLMYLTDLTPWPGLDLSILTFPLVGAIIMWGVFRFRLLDIVPVAREMVIENMDDVVIVLDNQNRVVDLNPAGERLIGRQASKAIGQPAGHVFSAWSNLVEACRRTETTHAEIMVGENATQRHFDLRVSPLSDRGGRSIGRVIALHDITEIKQAEEERERLIAELEAFAHTVAHDLKTPLGPIIGFAEILNDASLALSREDQQRYLDAIFHQGLRMKNIIDELLLLASVRQQDDVPIHALDMAGIVGNVLERLAFDIEEAQAEVRAPDAWPTALGYGPWVQEVWANYISNAIKYGGSPPHIELGATVEAGDLVRFWVRDDGPGIAPEGQARLFTPFTQLNQVHAKGHGLGLSIVQRIVEKLGGGVGVESGVGQGSTFYFTLPAANPRETGR